jgi:hypothetical protein
MIHSFHPSLITNSSTGFEGLYYCKSSEFIMLFCSVAKSRNSAGFIVMAGWPRSGHYQEDSMAVIFNAKNSILELGRA